MADTPDPNPVPTDAAAETQIVGLRVDFQGPLPPPEVLEGYARLVSSAPERILQMAERQAAHRQEIERRNSRRPWLGILTGSLIALALLGLAGYALYLGEPLVGGLLGGVDVAGLVAVYIYGTRNR